MSESMNEAKQEEQAGKQAGIQVENKAEKQAGKQALMKLRAARKETIALATARMKEHRKAIDAVKRQLAEGGRTVPEIAEATGVSTSQAMWYVATLKKYGEVLEGEKDGGYFRYELAGTSTGVGAEQASDAVLDHRFSET